MGLFDSALVGTVTSTGSVTEKKNSVIEKKSSATDEKKLSNRKKKGQAQRLEWLVAEPVKVTEDSPQHDIQNHHQHETNGESDGSYVRVLAFRCLWDQFFHNDI